MAGRRRTFTTRRKLLVTLASFAVLLVAVRMALPSFVQRYVNGKLDEIPDYDGHVGDIDLHLLRGAYVIKNVDLVKVAGRVEVPFFSAERADLSVQWGALLDGKLVGKISLTRPKLNFVSGPSPQQSQESVDSSWQDKVQALFPLRINSFEVSDGQIHYRDFHSDPKVDIFVDSLYVEAKNLTNSKDVSDTLFAVVEARGVAMKMAPVTMHLEIDPFAEQPTFELKASLRRLALPSLNDFIRAYGDFDFEKGTLSLDTELAAAGGGIKGYVKPLLNDVKIVDWKEDAVKPLKALWETAVGAVGALFTNPQKDRIGTEIPIEGKIEHPGTNIFAIIGGLLKNAFIRALTPGLEGKVDLAPLDSAKKRKLQEKAGKEAEKKKPSVP